jgi:protein-tyrosine phosphatase
MNNAMIDLHAHILPDIDDGPHSLAESLAMLQAMERQGIQTVVATAHALDGRHNATRDAILRATELLHQAIEEAGLTIRVLPSMEIYLGFDLLRAVKTGEAMGLNDSKYLVVELPHREFPAYTERAFFELMLAGYRPILNHPERNISIQKDPDKMYRLADKGVLAMVTAASLLGRFGTTAQHLAQDFLQDEVATLLVSDAHDLQGRGPLLPEGLAAARAFGKEDQAAEAALIR